MHIHNMAVTVDMRSEYRCLTRKIKTVRLKDTVIKLLYQRTGAWLTN